MTQEEWIKRLQKALRIKEDGKFGTITMGMSEEYDITVTAVLKHQREPDHHDETTWPVEPTEGQYFGARWIGVDLDLLGRNESDKELNARYVPEWAKVGLPQYKTLVGNTHAWCAIRNSKALRQVGIDVKGLTAAAASTSTFGRKCPFWFGALLDIQHTNSEGRPAGRHTCFFLYWIDVEARICATLDGNKGNLFCVAKTNLSGRPGTDKLVSGPRWPKNEPDGHLVSKATVLAKYPNLKVTGSGGGGTR